MGAAGRDFHNFNMVYRDDPDVDVVAFTAAQIHGIAGRTFPASLAGARYPRGIPIVEERALEEVCRRHKVDEVVFSYSDVLHATVMHVASRALSTGADFVLLGPARTMLRSTRPIVAVSAARTGCGKSQTSRMLSRRLRERGLRVAVIRHPMPYGDLATERVQRFASLADLDDAHCTAEEREEYEPHIELGNVVFAGIDYEAILRLAEAEADVIVWDGGNNDLPFVKPDLHIVVVDALRPSNIDTHHPGETTVRTADIVVIGKTDAASTSDTRHAIHLALQVNPRATIVRAASPVTVPDPAAIFGKRVLVVEDGPTLTHGGMSYGAGYVAATNAGAAEIVDPRLSAPPAIREVFAAYPHLGRVLPAVGYDDAQLAALGETIRRAACDVVVCGTPLDLSALVLSDKPIVRARYEFADVGQPTLWSLVEAFLAKTPVG